MIKAQELRIGNLVGFYKPNLPEMQIGTVDGVWLSPEENEYAIHIPKFSRVPLTELGVKPIPLTEDWLIKLGLERYEGWYDVCFWCRPQDVDNYYRFELMETLQGYEMNGGGIAKSVHVLQNCFYFHTFTGEELTIKE